MRCGLTRLRTITVAGAVTVGLLASGAGFAQASAGLASTPEDVVSAAGKVSVVVPGTRTVVTPTGDGLAELTLPGEVTTNVASPDNVPAGLFEGQGHPVVNTRLDDAVVSSYVKDNGTQTLIRIESAAAGTEYRFPLSIPAGDTAAVEADGSVAVRDRTGVIVGGYRVPWAYDATGVEVPTRFTLDGNTLIQTVGFDENTVFPVTADPNGWWGWTQCVAAVGGMVAGNMFIATKIAKFGGVAKFAKMLIEARNASERWRAILAVIGEITGVGQIMDKCK